jgi:hypothetical protein
MIRPETRNVIWAGLEAAVSGGLGQSCEDYQSRLECAGTSGGKGRQQRGLDFAISHEHSGAVDCDGVPSGSRREGLRIRVLRNADQEYPKQEPLHGPHFPGHTREMSAHTISAAMAAGPGAASAWASLMADNDPVQALTACRKSVSTDVQGRRYCSMPVWLDPPTKAVPRQ